MADRQVLVTGATGRLGAAVATALRENHNLTPRVLIRPQHLEAPDWQPPAGVEVAAGDYTDDTSLRDALEGIESVFLVSPVHPEMRERELALANLAARVPQPPHIVKISGLGTRLDSFVDSGRWHAEIERGISELGLRATFLRPLFFMQNLSFQLARIRATGQLHGGVGDARIAMVDLRDIAEVAAALLADEQAGSGQSLTLTGSAAYTYDQIADVCAQVLERPVSYARQTLDEVSAALIRGGQPDWHQRILLQFNDAFIRGWGSNVSDSVERILGRPPRRLEDTLAEFAADDRATGSDPFPS